MRTKGTRTTMICCIVSRMKSKRYHVPCIKLRNALLIELLSIDHGNVLTVDKVYVCFRNTASRVH